MDYNKDILYAFSIAVARLCGSAVKVSQHLASKGYSATNIEDTYYSILLFKDVQEVYKLIGLNVENMDDK